MSPSAPVPMPASGGEPGFVSTIPLEARDDEIGRQPPAELVLHPLNAPGLSGIGDAVWSHQTGRPGSLRRKLENLFRHFLFDVIHLHNISLMGAEDLVRLAARESGTAAAITMHDYWWICPQSLFWKFGRMVCDSPQCFTCNLRRRIPPQVWRNRERPFKVLSGMDVILFPSRSAAEVYRDNGFMDPGSHILPGILPLGWEDDGASQAPKRKITKGIRPYFAAAGRLVSEKGFQTLIPLMKNLPEMDLLIAGDGLMKNKLELQSRGLGNVKFLGLISSGEVKDLFKGARAVVIPSLFPETFGLVAAEAVSLGVPVIAKNSGALPEVIDSAGFGELYRSPEELLLILKRMTREGASGRPGSDFRPDPPDVWFERSHVTQYLKIISESEHGRKKGVTI